MWMCNTLMTVAIYSDTELAHVQSAQHERSVKRHVFRSRFTSIVVDWRVLAADRRRYDVIFVGTGLHYTSLRAINIQLEFVVSRLQEQ